MISASKIAYNPHPQNLQKKIAGYSRENKAIGGAKFEHKTFDNEIYSANRLRFLAILSIKFYCTVKVKHVYVEKLTLFNFCLNLTITEVLIQ